LIKAPIAGQFLFRGSNTSFGVQFENLLEKFNFYVRIKKAKFYKEV